MDCLWVFSVIVVSTTIRASQAITHDVYILGLFPMEGSWRGGRMALEAAELALYHINNREDILPGYNLKLVWNDTKCDPGLGTDVMFRNLYREDIVIQMILGAGCSLVSQATSQAAHLWNQVAISYISTSPALSDKTRFPRFFRLNAPDTKINPARVEIIHQFGWNKVATIHQSLELFSTILDDLLDDLSENNITVITSEIFRDDPRTQIENLKAYKQNLYGPKVVWFITGWLEESWWLKLNDSKIKDEVDCSIVQLTEAIEGHFAIRTIYLNPQGERGEAGYSPSEFTEAYRNKTNGERYFGDIKASLSYDCTWAIALALNASLTNLTGSGIGLEHFSYVNHEMGLLHLQSMQQINFLGIRGPTFFDTNGDPETLMSLDRVQGGVRQTIGIYHPAARNGSKIQWYEQPSLVWYGGRPPKDSVEIIITQQQVSPVLFAVFCLLSSIGIIIAISFLVFNQFFRAEKIIKMSSPRLNNIILIGCAMIYSTVFYEDVIGDARYLCQIRTFAVITGFSLTFGGLFSKTWRVYAVFTNPKLERKVITDRRLFVMVGALLAVNMSAFITWEAVDSQRKQNYNITPEVSDNGDIVIQPQLSRCESNYQLYFLGVLYGIQGVLMLFGAFLAWETRKVKLQALNDSQFIGMSIYNVVVLSLLAVIISVFVDKNVNLLYGLLSAITVFGTTATQCLVFVPKILHFKESRINPDGESGTSIKINTVSSTMTKDFKIIALQTENRQKDQLIQQLRRELDDVKRNKEGSAATVIR